MRQNGHEAKFVSLDEFIETAKQSNVKLLVELKPHGKEPADYTQRVIDILKKHGVEHQYRVMSLDYDVMTKLKKKRHIASVVISFRCSLVILKKHH